MMNDPALVKKIELHFFFVDESHTMDAFVRNRCETEFLAIIKEVSALLGIKLRVEASPSEKGGLIEFFNFIAENQYLVGVVSGVTINVLTKVISDFLKADPELEQLKKEKLRLQIRRLKNELSEFTPINSKIDMKEVSEIVGNSSTILRHKSEFYRQLNNYHKVTEISYAKLNAENEPVGPRAIVQRELFSSLIVEPDKLHPIIDTDASIEIISPVLKRGKNQYKYKWKGIYDKTGLPIDFTMNDEKYESDIFKSGVSFKTGTSISCVLKIERKLSENGEEINTGYSVEVVTSKTDSFGTVKTSHGEDYLKRKRAENMQLSLFNISELMAS